MAILTGEKRKDLCPSSSMHSDWKDRCSTLSTASFTLWTDGDCSREVLCLDSTDGDELDDSLMRVPG
jgi:hypothetical protein